MPKEKKDPEKTKKIHSKGTRPRIDGASFGSITIDGREIGHDVILRLDGSVEKRKKKLSKKVYGTSHTISLKEAKHIYEKGAVLLIIGTGHSGLVELSGEAEKYFREQSCRVKATPTPQAIHIWNNSRENSIGLIHVTC